MARLPKGYTKRTDGKLQYAFYHNDTRHYVYGLTVKECESKAAAKKEELQRIADNPQYIDNKTITLAQYFDEWIERRRGTVKDGTIYDNKRRFARVSDLIGGRRLQAIERREIIALQKTLSEMTVKTAGGSKPRYTTAGINLIISQLYSVFESARIDRIIDYNPAADIKSIRRTETKARDTIHRALTEKEQALFFKYAKDTYYYYFFALLINTGLRAGEAAALTPFDIDFKRHTLRVCKTLSRIDDKNWTISNTPKTDSSNRTISMTTAVESILKAQMQQNRDLSINNPGNRIFINSKGGYVTSSTTCTCIKKICEKIREKEKTEFEKFSAHAFRDTFATRFVEQSSNYKALQTILGHSSINMTMDLYAHALPDTIEKEMQNIRIVI